MTCDGCKCEIGWFRVGFSLESWQPWHAPLLRAGAVIRENQIWCSEACIDAAEVEEGLDDRLFKAEVDIDPDVFDDQIATQDGVRFRVPGRRFA